MPKKSETEDLKLKAFRAKDSPDSAISHLVSQVIGDSSLPCSACEPRLQKHSRLPGLPSREEKGLMQDLSKALYIPMTSILNHFFILQNGGEQK